MSTQDDTSVSISPILSELETLNSIYIDELVVDYDQNGVPIGLSIQLFPSTADKREEQYVTMSLFFKLPVDYPDTVPEIAIRNSRGLLDDQVDNINKSLVTIADKTIGSSMLFELIEAAKELLTLGNMPMEDCAICLFGFHEKDVITKTECYHYFHSHCLSRYIGFHQNHCGDKKDDLNQSDEEVLCPICRLHISFSARDDFPEPLAISEIDPILYNIETYRTEKMNCMFQKQLAQGGIINVEEERNKFRLEISSVDRELPNASTMVTNTNETESSQTSSSVIDNEDKVPVLDKVEVENETVSPKIATKTTETSPLKEANNTKQESLNWYADDESSSALEQSYNMQNNNAKSHDDKRSDSGKRSQQGNQHYRNNRPRYNNRGSNNNRNRDVNNLVESRATASNQNAQDAAEDSQNQREKVHDNRSNSNEVESTEDSKSNKPRESQNTRRPYYNARYGNRPGGGYQRYNDNAIPRYQSRRNNTRSPTTNPLENSNNEGHKPEKSQNFLRETNVDPEPRENLKTETNLEKVQPTNQYNEDQYRKKPYRNNQFRPPRFYKQNRENYRDNSERGPPKYQQDSNQNNRYGNNKRNFNSNYRDRNYTDWNTANKSHEEIDAHNINKRQASEAGTQVPRQQRYQGPRYSRNKTNVQDKPKDAQTYEQEDVGGQQLLLPPGREGNFETETIQLKVVPIDEPNVNRDSVVPDLQKTIRPPPGLAMPIPPPPGIPKPIPPPPGFAKKTVYGLPSSISLHGFQRS